MWEKLEEMVNRYQELEEQMARPEVATDLKRLRTLAKERAAIEDLVAKYQEYKATIKSLAETQTMLDEKLDEDMAALARQEIEELESKQQQLEKELKTALLPHDANDTKDIITEIRAGTGGEEAALFAADLFRMYSHYAQAKGWEIDIINMNESNIGGIKEVVFEIKGRGAFSRLKYERGVHRVQRVPTTESSGRVHTSTATVAVLPVADEVDVEINPDDLRIDIFHSGSAGGQNVNKVATAVRITHLPTGIVAITHLPTGIVATCQDERSQLRNKNKAMSVLRARLLDVKQRKQEEMVTSQRRSQVGTGDRAEKIRTYNFPQDRLSDHRIGLSLHNLPRIMTGELDELIDTLATSQQTKQLEV
jgi:peptide chain release factor 1